MAGLVLGGCVLACSPSPSERVAVIQALHAEGRFSETSESISELFQRFPDDPEVMRLYGATMLALDNTGLAIWPLRRLVEHSTAGIEDHMMLARALGLGGARQQAFEAVAEVLAADPDRMEGLTLQAELALELDEFEVLRTSAERLTELEPRARLLAYVWRAKALAGLDRFDEAYDALESGTEVLAARRDVAALWRPRFCLAGVEIAEKVGDTVELEARWEGCLHEFPAHPELVSGAVDFFDAKGERARATAILERAIERAPLLLAYRTELANRLAAERRFDEALAVLMHATELERISGQAWMAVADYHRDQDDFASAMQAMERALAGSDSVYEFVLAQYAEDCIQAGQLENAEGVMAKIERPEYAALLRGRLHLVRGEPQQALEALHEGLRLFQGNPAARYLTGLAAERLGDLELAIGEYRDAIRSGPTDSDAVFALARLYEAEGNIGGMHHILQLRLNRDSGDVVARAEVARLRALYGDNANVDGARAAIEELAALPGQDTAAAIAAARHEDRLAGPDAAATAIESRGLDLTRPEHVEALRALVRYLAQADRAAEAALRTQAALNAHLDFAPFHEVHANALHAAGRSSEEIEQALGNALELDPESVSALVGLSRLAADSDRVDEAIDLLDRAAAADHEDPAPAWRAIQVLLAADREEQIDARLEDVLMRDAIHAGALNLRVRRLLAQGGDLDDAEALAKRAVRFGGGHEAITTFGLVALERGEPARAVRALRYAAQKRPRSSTTQYTLARAFEAAGNPAGAIAALRRALAGDAFPEADDARARLERLTAKTPNEAKGEGESEDDSDA